MTGEGGWIPVCGVGAPVGEIRCTLYAGHVGVHESPDAKFKTTWFGRVWFYRNGAL